MIPKSHEKHVEKIQFFILCWQCICWLWWARGVSGNVSRALQTRKMTKICTAFHIIHYNRDSNTNWTPAAPRYSVFVLTLLSRCTENDLLQKLLGVRQIPASSVRTRTYVNFPPELIAGHKPSREISGHQHSQQIFMICNTAWRAFLEQIMWAASWNL